MRQPRGVRERTSMPVGLILLNQMVRTPALITAGSPRIYDGTFDTISQFSFSTIAAGLSQIFHVASWHEVRYSHCVHNKYADAALFTLSGLRVKHGSTKRPIEGGINRTVSAFALSFFPLGRFPRTLHTRTHQTHCIGGGLIIMLHLNTPSSRNGRSHHIPCIPHRTIIFK